MSGRAKKTWAVIALLAMACAIVGWPIYKKLSLKAASAAMMERTKEAVEKKPHLKPDLEKAMKEHDGVLTQEDAKAILEKAGEKVEPDE
jgi:hypothetical protein